MSAVVSGCSLLSPQNPQATLAPPPASALMLRQADERGYAAGFAAGKRYQYWRDRRNAEAEAAKASLAPGSASSDPASSASAVPGAVASDSAASGATEPGASVPDAAATGLPATGASAPAASTPVGPASASSLVPSALAAPAQTAQATAQPPRPDPAPAAPPAGNFVPRGVASPLGGSSDPF